MLENKSVGIKTQTIWNTLIVFCFSNFFNFPQVAIHALALESLWVQKFLETCTHWRNYVQPISKKNYFSFNNGVGIKKKLSIKPQCQCHMHLNMTCSAI